MATKEESRGNNKANLKQQSPDPAAKNSDAPARQQDQPPALVQRSMSSPGLLSPLDVLQLQSIIGNQATGKVLASRAAHPATLVQPPRQPGLAPTVVQDEGKTETGQLEGRPVDWCEAETATLEPGEANEWGEMDGALTSNVKPHVFVNGGKTGSGVVNWAGGNGGQGNQTTGSIALVAPQYESENADATNPDHTTAWAWIRPGTGTATVTRSYRGVQVGANTSAYYFTARASARADVHEELHVASSRALHNTHITPLEARVARYTGRAQALRQGATPAEAIAALQAIINWNASVTAFSNADTAANTPMGTVDRADMASPTFIRNYGPRDVGGTTYPNYIDTPPGP